MTESAENSPPSKTTKRAILVANDERNQRMQKNCAFETENDVDNPIVSPTDRNHVSSFSRVNLSSSGIQTGFQSADAVRVVAVRYFLDRPGYGLHNSAMRLWFHPPAICDCRAVKEFLQEQGIALPGLLVELYLDQFQSFMMLEACATNFIEWDFSETNVQNVGYLNVRLTDIEEALSQENGALTGKETKTGQDPLQKVTQMPSSSWQLANVTPAGLFSFSMMAGMEAGSLLIQLLPGTVSPAYYLTWGPCMFFIGGVLQILVAIFQVLRNNVYGAVAFLGFGSIYLATGATLILRTYFASSGTIAGDELLHLNDPLGNFIRLIFTFGLACGIETQTFALNKLVSTVIALSCTKIFVSCVVSFTDPREGISTLWTQFAFGCLTSLLAFYIFLVEFTNQVYQKEVFKVFRWNEDESPEEVFGAAGRSGTLHSKATRLRQAQSPNPRILREAVGASHKFHEA